jgi:phage terminase large subunit-like protein
VRVGRFGRSEAQIRRLVSLAKELNGLDESTRKVALAQLNANTLAALRALQFEWYLFARPKQLAPEGNWRWWVMPGGRGSGKTRPAAEQVIEWADINPGSRICLLGRDAGSVRRIMIDGESGIIQRSPPWFKPRLHKTEKKLTWPNGTTAEFHSSEEPGTLRGPQYHFAWVTELFHFQIPRREKEPVAWKEGVKLTLRLGQKPQGIIDSSPRSTEFCATLLLGPEDDRGLRPITREMMETGEWDISHELTDHRGNQHTYSMIVRRERSEDNADNLAPGIVAEWRHDLKGTRLESQELDGEILVKVAGALWSTEILDNLRVGEIPRIVKSAVAIDPTRSNTPVDEAGIMYGALCDDGHVYLIDDLSTKGTPAKWAKAALAGRNLYSAGALVLEKNRMEEKTLGLIRALDPAVKWVMVTATDGKLTRAEPVSAMYELGKVHHVHDAKDPRKFSRLEDEMISYNPRTSGVSPNRMDALVWLVTYLFDLGREARKPIGVL